MALHRNDTMDLRAQILGNSLSLSLRKIKQTANR